MKDSLFAVDKNSNINYCPRCNELVKKGDTICSKCGYDFESVDQTIELTSLNFGLNEQENITTSSKVEDGTYGQVETKAIKICKIIYIAFLYLIAVLSILVIVLPIFSDSNFFTSALLMKEQGYKISLFEYFALDSNTNFFDLFEPLKTYSQNEAKVLNTSMMMYYYELFVLLIVGCIALSGGGILYCAIYHSITGKKSPLDRRLIGLNLALAMILIFALNASGFGPVLVASICGSSLIFFYISGVLSKEKRFLLKQLIHKSICMIALFALLVLSCVGLVNLNVDLGVNLFTFDSYPTSGELLTDSIFSCKGFFYEYMQFVQSTSGDDVFTTVTFIFNILTFVSHIVYVFFIVFAIVDLLKSLSKQNVKFPVHSIIIATVGFYAFAIFTIIFNQVVNEAMYQKFVEAMGNESFGSFNKNQIEQYRNLNSIFTLKTGMVISMILNLPACVYAVIARKICLKRVY